MNHNCHGEFFIANGTRQYRCFADSSVISAAVCSGDQCPSCGRTIVAVTVEADEEVDLKGVLEQRFAAGLGVVTLSASMTDEQILTLIKGACTWSKGKAFQVIQSQSPSTVESQAEPYDLSKGDPFATVYFAGPKYP